MPTMPSCRGPSSVAQYPAKHRKLKGETRASTQNEDHSERRSPQGFCMRSRKNVNTVAQNDHGPAHKTTCQRLGPEITKWERVTTATVKTAVMSDRASGGMYLDTRRACMPRLLQYERMEHTIRHYTIHTTHESSTGSCTEETQYILIRLGRPYIPSFGCKNSTRSPRGNLLDNKPCAHVARVLPGNVAIAAQVSRPCTQPIPIVEHRGRGKSGYREEQKYRVHRTRKRLDFTPNRL